MKNEQFEQQFAEYIDGTLPPRERAEIERHLAEDPELAEQIALVRRLHPMVRSLPDEDTPPDLTDAILQATTRRRRFFLKDRVRSWTDSFRFVPAMATAVVAIVASVGLFGYLKYSDPGFQNPALTIATKAVPKEMALDMIAGENERPADALAEAVYRLGDEDTHLREVTTSIPSLGEVDKSALAGSAVPPPSAPPSSAVKKSGEKMDDAPRKAPYRSPSPAGGIDRGLSLRPVTFGKYEGRKGDAFGSGATRGRAMKRKAVPPPTSRMAPGVQSKMELEEKASIGVPITHRWQGYHCGVAKRATITAATQGQWRKLWSLLAANRVPPPPAPTVDFTKHAVVGVFMGLHNTGGFAVEILSVKRDGNKLIVVIKETIPQLGQAVTQALTQPFSVVLIPREVDGLKITPETPLVVVRAG